MVSYLNILFYGVGGLVVAGMALLVAFQEKLVYVPVLPGLTKSYPITPSRLRLSYEDVWLTSSDGVRLHAWFIKLFPNCQGFLLQFLPISIFYSCHTHTASFGKKEICRSERERLLLVLIVNGILASSVLLGFPFF